MAYYGIHCNMSWYSIVDDSAPSLELPGSGRPGRTWKPRGEPEPQGELRGCPDENFGRAETATTRRLPNRRVFHDLWGPHFLPSRVGGDLKTCNRPMRATRFSLRVVPRAKVGTVSARTRCSPLLRTNGVNTNGVTANISFVDEFEQVLKIYVWEMTQFCMQPSPSRRNNNHGSQPMRTMLGKQRCMPYACARWFPCVCRCMDMYGYICLWTNGCTRKVKHVGDPGRRRLRAGLGKRGGHRDQGWRKYVYIYIYISCA